MSLQPSPDEFIDEFECTGRIDQLQTHFPGLIELVNFFEAAASRCAASPFIGTLPSEVYERVINFVDYETWKTCLSVCRVFRACCLRKHRLIESKAIIGGPFERQQNPHSRPHISFMFEDLKKGEVRSMTQVLRCQRTEELEGNWMPIVGSKRKALMTNVNVQFKPAHPAQVEGDVN
ncbi:unnamed protein product [Penicillium salamii]|uniref:F-box domain-containing protein n=1 Tax=Penicillium salamii TaxID=1612424 RepID=A0A9W4MZH2_9EURO|nr:unnamed protein product [Penicillium salamii]CAG7968458.1 unnamed protein product [Penicillium salamii]CAG8040726.1 unnamed protein product [Penicillium salamii]CAG8066196.1 unnamed protein product [Penicillium salamii]CAG8210145.1 unnamed protein product [Penicillium salamii]